MKPGDKVIYSFSAGMENHHPRQGYLIEHLETHPLSYVGITPDAPTNECDCVFNKKIHPYSDALWTAWQRWLQDEKTHNEQHRRLIAGSVPEELLTIGMF